MWTRTLIAVSPTTNENAQPCSFTCHLKSPLSTPVVPPKGAALGRTGRPREGGRSWTPGLTGTPSPSPPRGKRREGAPGVGADRPHRLHPAPPPTSSRSLSPSSYSITFPVKTNPWGRGRRRSSRGPGQPRQQTPNTRFGRRSVLTAARSPPLAGPGVSGERVSPYPSPGAPTVGSRSQGGRWHRPSGMEGSGPAVATPAASGAPSLRPPRHPPCTRRPRPAPTQDGGSRSEDWGSQNGASLPVAPASQRAF